MNPFHELKVPVSATLQEIEKAYKRRRLQIHPDKAPNDPYAKARFQALTNACEPLFKDVVDGRANDPRARLRAAVLRWQWDSRTPTAPAPRVDLPSGVTGAEPGAVPAVQRGGVYRDSVQTVGERYLVTGIAEALAARSHAKQHASGQGSMFPIAPRRSTMRRTPRGRSSCGPSS